MNYSTLVYEHMHIFDQKNATKNFEVTDACKSYKKRFLCTFFGLKKLF